MISLKYVWPIVCLGFAITTQGCKEAQKKTSTPVITKSTHKPTIIPEGDYATESYSKRAEGYDWVGVRVRSIDTSTLRIDVRSRADRKRPSCTFSATARKRNNSRYYSIAKGRVILFNFTKNSVSISTEKPSDSTHLYFYCNGGGTLAGTYQKIPEKLDENQIDKTQFLKSLNLQDIDFLVTSKPSAGGDKIHILTRGLANRVVDFKNATIKGEVVRAKVEDLDGDGSPELVIISQMQDDSKTEFLKAFSVVNKKQVVAIAFSDSKTYQLPKDAWVGHSKFTLTKNRLIERFPFHGTEDIPDGRTRMRQISYQLTTNGVGKKVFKISKVSDY